MAYAFELTEQFAPVPLLKTYLKDARKNSQIKAGSPSAAQNEANKQELAAFKTAIKCIEEHKLEELYPVHTLQKRVLQLEKAKADKKRAAEAAKPQPKNPRANGVNYSPRPSNIADKSFYKALDRYPYMYDRPYMYAAPDNHNCSLLGSVTYNLSPSHGNYFGNGYQYPVPYLH